MSRTFYAGSNLKFGDVSHELLTDYLCHLNTLNKKKLLNLHDCCDCFRDTRLMGGSTATLTVRPPAGSRSMGRCHAVAGCQHYKEVVKQLISRLLWLTNLSPDIHITHYSYNMYFFDFFQQLKVKRQLQHQIWKCSNSLYLFQLN